MDRVVTPVFLVLLLTLAAHGAPPSRTLSTRTTVLAVVERALPSKVTQLEPGRTTRLDAEKLFGRPMKGSTATEQYYQVAIKHSLDLNDLTLGFERDRLRYYYFSLGAMKPGTGMKFSDLKPLLTPAELSRVREEDARQLASFEGGRAVDVVLPASGIVLKFKRTDEAPLESVLRWKAGEKMP